VTPLAELGYARCRALTRQHARSFHLASHLLFGERRRAAFALYAFCRRLDDHVDLEAPGNAGARLEQARRGLSCLFQGGPVETFVWPREERAALEHALERFAIPLRPFEELLDGMEMDLLGHRYRTEAELQLYCHRVAGTVGEMMAPVLGFTAPEALLHAETLGRAMQLTNILRDVREDLERGRLYLPEEHLERFGVSAQGLWRKERSAALDQLIAFEVGQARQLYASAAQGIPMLLTVSSRATVRVMSHVYGGILDVIERRGFDVLSGRARLGALGKAARFARALLPEMGTISPRRLGQAGFLAAGERVR
jgi:phytoene synthase